VRAQLGEVPLADVIGVHAESQTELVVVVANSQRPPYCLKASSAAQVRCSGTPTTHHTARISNHLC
jgi:hypothetical protein